MRNAVSSIGSVFDNISLVNSLHFLAFCREDKSEDMREHGQQEEYDISEDALALRLRSASGGTRKDGGSVDSLSAQGAGPLDSSNPPRNASFLLWTDPDAPSYGDEVFISGEAFEKFLAEDERAVAELGTDLPQNMSDFSLNSAYLKEANRPFGNETKTISIYLREKSRPLGNLDGNGEKPFFGPWPIGSCYVK